MGLTPFYGARAEKTQKADFAMKQTNVCRLSGDINYLLIMPELIKSILKYISSISRHNIIG